MSPAACTKTVLSNGFRVLLIPESASPTATVLMLVEAGSEYETKERNGISHFLEHLVFKGTTARPSPDAIASELDGLGAEYNAFTGEEYTGYWAKAEAGKLPQLMDLVADLYLDPLFRAEDIEKERGVVTEEINMNEDTPMRHVNDVFTRLMYGDAPAGWSIAGEKATIARLARKDFVAYRAERYLPAATALIIAGRFRARDVIAFARARFGGLPRRRAAPKAHMQPSVPGPAVAIAFKESAQSHLVLGFRAFDAFDRRRHALKVLANILGGGMSSRLFRRVRGELGAAYYVNAGNSAFLDHGHLTIAAGVEHAQTETVLRAIAAECARLAKELVGAEELRKAKDHLVGNMVINLETSDQVAGFYGGQEIMTRKPLAIAAVIRSIRAVSAADIRAAAKAVFRPAGEYLAVIGPYRDETLLRGAIGLA